MKIMSYNIHMGSRLKVVIKEFRERGLMDELAVICLQEVGVSKKEDSCQEIIRAFPKLPLDYKIEPFHEFHGKTQANAIIWRTDLLEEVGYETFELPRAKLSEVPFLRKLFSKGFFMKKIVCQNILFQAADKSTIRVFNTHLDAFTNWVHTFYQMRRILRKCKRQSRRIDTVYICGDLNTVTVTRGDDRHFLRFKEFLKVQRLTDLTSHIKNTYQFKSEEVQSFVVSPILTRLAAFLKASSKQKLDWILVRRRGRKIISKKAEIIKMPGSDHLPVAAEMDI